ncbi:MAG: AAA family ATPase [Candidatus Woesearchaeota archaeon]
MQPVLIIVTGLPGTGKTTIGKQISNRFSLPFICKDSIKEVLFDELGWNEKDLCRKIGGASYELLYHFVEMLLESRSSVVVEANFVPEIANHKFHQLRKLDFIPVQIRCFARQEIILERFKKREESKRRHPGHRVRRTMEEWIPILSREKSEFLSIGGKKFDLDTTSSTTLGELEQELDQILGKSSG